MIIDATNLIVGRFATVAAKKALLGEKVDIINCEKALMTGKRDEILERFVHKMHRGTYKRGPFLHRSPDRMVRRIVRGMLPFRQSRGREAFKNVMCYIGIPTEFKDKKAETIKEANISKLPNLNYISIGEISKHLSGK